MFAVIIAKLKQLDTTVARMFRERLD